MKLLKYFLAGVATAIVFFLVAPSNTAEATSNKIPLKESIVKAVREMETVMNNSYHNQEKQLTELAKEGYDYELTAESFYDKGKPFTDYDYLRFIAVYATIQKHMYENNLDIGEGINEIDFVQMEYEDSFMKEYAIKETNSYEENEDGNYVISGTQFITEPGYIDIYDLNDDGVTYSKNGQEYVELDTKATKYADITLSIISFEDVYKTFGLDREDFKEAEEQKYLTLESVMGDSSLEQNVFITTRTKRLNEDDKAIIENAYNLVDDSSVRKTLINVAASIIGDVPYEWGGKSTKEGYDLEWYTFDDTGKQKGLDCSGYIQWILRTSGYTKWDELVSTTDFLNSDNVEMIQVYDLRPGDFGLFYPDSTSINHIGMYLGNGYWIHCSSDQNTVVIDSNSKFSVYRRLKNIDFLSISQVNMAAGSDYQAVEDILTVSDEDIMWMAKIVQCESYGEGFNGWVAVAEVIRNRVFSSAFKADNIYDVVSGDKQFVTYKMASNMSDKDVDVNIISVCREVCAGSMGIINNPDVIGFKRVDGSETWNGWDHYRDIGNHAFYILPEEKQTK